MKSNLWILIDDLIEFNELFDKLQIEEIQKKTTELEPKLRHQLIL